MFDDSDLLVRAFFGLFRESRGLLTDYQFFSGSRSLLTNDQFFSRRRILITDEKFFYFISTLILVLNADLKFSANSIRRLGVISLFSFHFLVRLGRFRSVLFILRFRQAFLKTHEIFRHFDCLEQTWDPLFFKIIVLFLV